MTTKKINNLKELKLINSQKATTGSIYETYYYKGVLFKVRYSDHSENVFKNDADISFSIENYNDKNNKLLILDYVENKYKSSVILKRSGINKNVLGFDEVERLGGYVYCRDFREKKYHINDTGIGNKKVIRIEGDYRIAIGVDEIIFTTKDFHRNFDVIFVEEGNVSTLPANKHATINCEKVPDDFKEVVGAIKTKKSNKEVVNSTFAEGGNVSTLLANKHATINCEKVPDDFKEVFKYIKDKTSDFTKNTDKFEEQYNRVYDLLKKEVAGAIKTKKSNKEVVNSKIKGLTILSKRLTGDKLDKISRKLKGLEIIAKRLN